MTNGDRHVSIDAVRGFAVLGILLMNIVGMGLPTFAYITPTYYGGHEGANLWAWAINYVVADGKMRALFTMLFGASMILIADRDEHPGRPLAEQEDHRPGQGVADQDVAEEQQIGVQHAEQEQPGDAAVVDSGGPRPLTLGAVGDEDHAGPEQHGEQGPHLAVGDHIVDGP
ncbi:MAG: hypothetical protein EON95_19340, partial [Caulobacteraceae bacterium]